VAAALWAAGRTFRLSTQITLRIAKRLQVTALDGHARDTAPRLLLVEDRDILELLALCGGPAGGDGAALAIGGDNNATSDRDLSTFFDAEIQGPVIDLRVRARV